MAERVASATTAVIRPTYGLRKHPGDPRLAVPSASGWTANQLEIARELTEIARRFRREAAASVTDLCMLAVCIQESSLSANNPGDSGQSFGPFQIYQVAHPNTNQLAISPWADYAYGPVCWKPWELAWRAVGGNAAWADIASRGAFIEAFAPQAQGSIRWPAGLGRLRYLEALNVLELIA